MTDELIVPETETPDENAHSAATAGRVGEQLVSAGLNMRRAQYNLISLAAAFESSNEWARAGCRTAAHWIGEQLDVTVSTAREWIRVGRALEELPALDKAFASNELSYSKVRTLTRLATPENEKELIELATSVPAGQLGMALADWSQRKEDPSVRDRRLHEQRSYKSAVQPDGSGLITIRLPPAEFESATAVIDAIVMGGTLPPATAPRLVEASEGRHSGDDTSSDAHLDDSTGPDLSVDAAVPLRPVPHRWPSLAQQRADAFVWLLENGGGEVVTEVVLHVRGGGNTFDDGTPVTDSVVEKLLPESFIRLLIHDAESTPINASNRRRHPTARQKRVVRERDGSCIDCGSSELLEYDHVPEFELTGHTVVDELELRCGPCHRARHRRAA